MHKRILLLPGDGIGPEITNEAIRVLDVLRCKHGLAVTLEEGLIGGSAIDATGDPLPQGTLNAAREVDAVLLGAVGGPRWDHLDLALRPEKGLLKIRSELGLFANLRPARLMPSLAGASPLKCDVDAAFDMLIVRELTGGIYFGEPRGIRELANAERQGFNTLIYSESEIKRIARLAFGIAMQRNGALCSVDKANVLEATKLWREIVTEVASEYPGVKLTHMYVDNAAMQLVKAPKQFDVLLTTNMFGDILSDLASAVSGSIGMLPSASLDETGHGMYEPVHGSAPDIAGEDRANPLAMILSVAMLLRYSLAKPELANKVEAAVEKVLADGLRTPDIYSPGTTEVGTREMGDAVVKALQAV